MLLVALVVLVSELVEMLELTKSGSSASNVIPSSNSVKASESVDIILEQNRQRVCEDARLWCTRGKTITFMSVDEINFLLKSS